MRLLEGEERKEAQHFLEIAANVAKNSTCRKSQRGVIIVKNGKIVGKGNNNTTIEKLCDYPCALEREIREPNLCPVVHAEEYAILNTERCDLEGSRMYHIKVKDGKIKPSGEPSCTRCSPFVLASGISEFVLLHEEGPTVYTAQEFNEKTFQHYL
ncbi:MAG: hypothetical protein JW700_02885 [Candidatus Aenigmarchaeota archaeon]|nr:hypothetical protein [Candidatus Aenigmarchaeota archaeon]